ncbi:MAG: isopentenyl-diphosphate Delta-isomerase [Gammaproteobacteria bacterium]
MASTFSAVEPSHPIVSFDTEKLILVDKEDRETGSLSKFECHEGMGILHRAFSLFIFNEAGELLVQKRSPQKLLWPNFWSNSCCSHPRMGEDTGKAATRRLKEELQLSCEIDYLYKFQYHAEYFSIGSESEFCWVFIGASSEPARANANEVSEFRYIRPEQLDQAMESEPGQFTPWFRLEWGRIRKEYWPRVESIIENS